MPLSTNVDSALLSLTIDCVGFYCEREKPTGDSQYSAPLVDCFVRFFPHKRKQFHLSPWANTFFSFYEKQNKERVGRTRDFCRLSAGDSYQVWVWVWVWVFGFRIDIRIPVATRLPSRYHDVFPLEGEELSHRIILQSLRFQLNCERNHQMARGRSEYDLKGTQSSFLKTSAWVPRNLTHYKNEQMVVTGQSMKIIFSFIPKNTKDIGKDLRILWKEKWPTDNETSRHSSPPNSSSVQCRSEEFLWTLRRDEKIDDQLIFEDTSSRISRYSDQTKTFVDASIVIATREIVDEREEPLSCFTRQRTLNMLIIWPNRAEECLFVHHSNEQTRRDDVVKCTKIDETIELDQNEKKQDLSKLEKEWTSNLLDLNEDDPKTAKFVDSITSKETLSSKIVNDDQTKENWTEEQRTDKSNRSNFSSEVRWNSQSTNDGETKRRIRLINRRQGFSQSHLTDHRWNISSFAFHAMRVQQNLHCNIHSFATLLFRQGCFNWHSMLTVIFLLHRFRWGQLKCSGQINGCPRWNCTESQSIVLSYLNLQTNIFLYQNIELFKLYKMRYLFKKT